MKTRWGYSGVWMGEFLRADPDPHVAQLQFLREHSMVCTDIFLHELEEMSEAKRDRIFGLLEESGLSYVIRPELDLWSEGFSDDLLRRQVDQAIEQLQQYARPARSELLAFCSGPIHRFVREPSLERQLDRLESALRPLAAAAAELGLRCGIENHGDYYCSDLVELCRRVPHLGIYLDTGNCFLIGERPDPAFEAAAPYVVGSHFKDHAVRPNPQTLCFEIGGAVLGQGDAAVLACWEILKAKTPNLDELLMEIEWIPCPGRDHLEAVQASIRWALELD